MFIRDVMLDNRRTATRALTDFCEHNYKAVGFITISFAGSIAPISQLNRAQFETLTQFSNE